MLSLTMKATPASPQMRCSGSARRASSCSETSFTRSWKAATRARLKGRLQPLRERAADLLRKSGTAGRAPSAWAAGNSRIEFVVQGSGGDLVGRSLVDFVDRFAERRGRIPRRSAAWRRSESKRAAEAGDHARVLRELAAGVLARETAGQSDDPQHARDGRRAASNSAGLRRESRASA